MLTDHWDFVDRYNIYPPSLAPWFRVIIFTYFHFLFPHRFLLLSLHSSHCSSPVERDQSGDGLTVGVMTGWSWDPGRVWSAVLDTPGERAGETRQSALYPGVCTCLKESNKMLRVKCWGKDHKRAQQAQSRSLTDPDPSILDLWCDVKA